MNCLKEHKLHHFKFKYSRWTLREECEQAVPNKIIVHWTSAARPNVGMIVAASL